MEAERESRGRRAATPPPGPDAEARSRELGEARRKEIAREVEGYLTPPAKPAPAEPALVPPSPEPEVEPAPTAAAPAPAPANPASPAGGTKSQWDEELRFLLYVATSVAVVAAVLASVLLYVGS